MCGHKCSPGVENKCLRRCKTMEKQRRGKLLSRTCRNNRTSCYFSPGGLKILPTKRPPFGVQKRTPKWRPLIQSQFDLLVSGRLGPRFGVQKTDPKTGAVCRQNFCRRAKVVQVSIVSAGTRQKFCIPLGHWVHMVLQRREQLFSTPCERLCPHLFLNSSTEERPHDGGGSACGLWFVWLWVVLVVLVLFSTIRPFFPSFNDDLGTMPTRRPKKFWPTLDSS